VATPLPLTGERTTPGIWHENYWFRRHEAVYAAVPGWVRAPAGTSGLALDAGSGEGYGTALLATALPRWQAVGVDYDAAAAAHAARVHSGAATAYVRGALTALPMPDSCADLAVSLQVLEHIWTPGDYARELARVLRPGGLLVLSTPNRLTFSPGLRRHQRPTNAYHCREYDAAELVTELDRWTPDLAVENVLGVRHGARLRAWEAGHGGLVSAQQAGAPDSWAPALARAIRQVRARDFEISPDHLDTSLDLVVVARRAD